MSLAKGMAEKNDGSNQQSKENETKMMKRPPVPAVIVQEKVPITITHAARVVKLPKKLVMRNPSHHNPQLIQHYSQINDDPILDYLFNTLGGAKTMYPNVQSSGPLKAQYDAPRTRTIIYAPPVILKQPVQQHKQMESLMENALTSLLLDDSNALASADDTVCSPHSKSANANNNVSGSDSVAIASDTNIDDKSEMSNNDGNVIQFCSCHFIKPNKKPLTSLTLSNAMGRDSFSRLPSPSCKCPNEEETVEPWSGNEDRHKLYDSTSKEKLMKHQPIG
ncbi:hypothetical protein DOY81_002055 [Sarcophaga bullata]|nr:hypothetical protein DOY81_002055 [Sarcophaga bullata]